MKWPFKRQILNAEPVFSEPVTHPRSYVERKETKFDIAGFDVIVRGTNESINDIRIQSDDKFREFSTISPVIKDAVQKAINAPVANENGNLLISRYAYSTPLDRTKPENVKYDVVVDALKDLEQKYRDNPDELRTNARQIEEAEGKFRIAGGVVQASGTMSGLRGVTIKADIALEEKGVDKIIQNELEKRMNVMVPITINGIHVKDSVNNVIVDYKQLQDMSDEAIAATLRDITARYKENTKSLPADVNQAMTKHAARFEALRQGRTKSADEGRRPG